MTALPSALPASFEIMPAPHMHYGAGKREVLPEILSGFGKTILLVTGGRSFDVSPMCRSILESLEQRFDVFRIRVNGEPSPELVDAVVSKHAESEISSVLAIGGGSCIDAAKAIAGLLPSGESVMNYLEGVGHGKSYHGPSVPFVAAPTTAGTGGETSKNAVLSRVGAHGFKKSFRHESLIARCVVLDPELTLSCPAKITAACGLDAFTQLLESYVSLNANPVTDALAISGMSCVRDALIRVVEQGDDLHARCKMLYASSISGIALANAGLGSVHGLASPLGAFFPVPHGTVCGALLFAATRANVRAMRARRPESVALAKYAHVGRLLLKDHGLSDEAAVDGLLKMLDNWRVRLNMPRLSEYGMTESDTGKVVANARGSSMKTNPVVLTDNEIVRILMDCL